MDKITDLSFSDAMAMARPHTGHSLKFHLNLFVLAFARNTKAQDIAAYISRKEPKTISDIEEIANDYMYR